MRRRPLTRDKATAGVFTIKDLGDKQSLTPEGFLLCMDVPCARVGTMLYGPGETPIEVNSQGVAYVERGPDELFKEDTLASYVGKPITDDHPTAEVNPGNWKRLAKGTVLTARRGTGDDADVMLCDILITDAELIAEVQAGKREVSAGYEADYEPTGPGAGKQTNIVGNHIALVQRGRCGPRCSIGDEEGVSTTNERSLQMADLKKKVPTVAARTRKVLSAAIRRSFRDAEAQALEAIGAGGDEDDMTEDDDLMGDMPSSNVGNPGEDSHTHIHIHNSGGTSAPARDDIDGDPAAAAAGADPAADDPTEARFKSIETSIAEIKTLLAGKSEGAAAPTDPEEPTRDADDIDSDPEASDSNPNVDPEAQVKDSAEEDDDKKDPTKMTNDSAALHTAYRRVLADCEVLVPGFRMPTFDSKAKRKVTVDALCGARRRALDITYATADGAKLVETVNGGNVLKLQTMDCASVATLFKAAAGAKRLLNNQTHDGKDKLAVPQITTAIYNPGRVIQAPKGVKTPAELNAALKDHYSKQGVRA